MPPAKKRRGIALLAMLGLVAATGAVAASISLTDADFRRASTNRMSAERDQWIADGCAAIVISSIDGQLRNARGPSAINAIWAALDERLQRLDAALVANCELTLTPSGTAASVNSLSKAQLMQFLTPFESVAQRDSMSDALLDWRDGDDSTREFGAEQGWYRKAHRANPADSDFSSLEEIQLVRGWETADSVIALLTMEKDRIVLDRAPRAVLQTIDGLPAEAIDWIERNRKLLRGQDLSVMLDHLSFKSRALLAAQYAKLRAVTTAAPEAWYLQSEARSETGHDNRVKLKIIRAGDRVRVEQRWESGR